MTTEDPTLVADAELTQELHDEQEDVDDNYLVVLVAKGGVRLPPDKASSSRGFQNGCWVRQPLAWRTRFQEIGLPNRLPQELIFEVRCPGN